MSAPATLVTGAAGFIGMAVARRLLALGRPVVGVDNFTPYYDVALKEARLRVLEEQPQFRFERLDLADAASVQRLFEAHRPVRVIHLAAQPGVRYSLENPRAYVDSNLVAFANLLEACRHGKVEHLTYASSSSVYGLNQKMPFSVHDNVDHPVSLYAATKKANELMAHAYSHLFGLPTTALRFFTVYGPWGRPDMAVYAFTHAIAEGRPIRVYNHGRSLRDFTYVDDVVEGVVRASDLPATPDPAWSGAAPDPGSSRAPYRVYNIGNHTPVAVNELIGLIERELGKKAETVMLGPEPGDMAATYADVEDLSRDVGFSPATPLEEGIRRFVAWYREYHGR
ncbi:MAG TPA: NAD-dependent epimerase [Beijerinckiaceae bacterium]